MTPSGLATTEGAAALNLPRLDVHRPLSGKPRRVVVYVASGRQGLFDQLGADAELFERIAGQLLALRTAVVRFDCDGVHPRRLASDDTRLQARADRLAQVITWVRGAFDCPVTLMGLSLGALAICEIVARPAFAEAADTLLLCSACIDRPTAIMPGVREVRLVYGELDGVGYAEPGAAPSAVDPPSTYGPRCAGNLIVMPATHVSVEILPHQGHLLLRPGAHAPDEDTVARLVELASPTRERQSQPEVFA